MAPDPNINLRQATFADYEQIIGLESAQNLRSRSRDEWTRLWLDNPLYKQLAPDWPIGWVLEDSGRRIVGTIGNIPVPYVFQGRKLIVAAGRAWAVEERYRSVALMLMDTYFSQQNVDMFLNTTVNALAAEGFGVFGSSPVPAGDWSAASYWVTGYAGFARTALTVKKFPAPQILGLPAGACLYLKDLVAGKRLPAASREIEVQRGKNFDGRFDTFWERLAAQRSFLLGVRNRDVLEWHFGPAVERGDAWLFTVADGSKLAAYAIFQRRDEPRTGLKRIRLVDFQTLEGDSGCLRAILVEALRLARQTGIHILEKVGREIEDTRLIDEHAPYRRKLPAWPFFFLAPDPELQQKLQSPAAWQPSSFDGDASL
jgi:hypothetical protein